MSKSRGYWTFDKVKEEAFRFNSRGDFQKESRSAYLRAYNNGWLNEVCSHMIGIYKPDGYWNYNNIKEEALKFDDRSSFKKNSKAYVAALKAGYLDDVCSHMIMKGNIYKRYVYKAYFDDNSVYIGLTYNLNKRICEHLTKPNSSVYKHMISIDSKPKFELIENVLLSKENVAKRECEVIKEYEDLGFNILNKKKGGGLGGSIITWTFDRVKEEALKFSNRSDFQKGSNGAYSSANRNGWSDEVCSHMVILIKRWTFDKVEAEALKFINRSGFQKGSNGAYCAAHRNGWLDKVCSHMYKSKDSDFLKEKKIKINII